MGPLEEGEAVPGCEGLGAGLGDPHPTPSAAPSHHEDVPGGDSQGLGAHTAGDKAGTVPLCIPRVPFQHLGALLRGI